MLHATTARARLRRHGRAAQHPGRRAVALRRHGDRQPGAGAGGRDPRRSRRAGRRGRRRRPTRSRRSTPISPAPAGGFYTTGYIGVGRRPDAGRHRRGPAARLRACAPTRTSSSRCCAPRRMAAVVAGGALRRQPGRADGDARRGRRADCSPPRRACSTCAPSVGSRQEAVEQRQGAAGVGARDARPGAGEDHRDRSAGGGLGLPALEMQLESIYTVTSRLAEPALRQLHARSR